MNRFVLVLSLVLLSTQGFAATYLETNHCEGRTSDGYDIQVSLQEEEGEDSGNSAILVLMGYGSSESETAVFVGTVNDSHRFFSKDGRYGTEITFEMTGSGERPDGGIANFATLTVKEGEETMSAALFCAI